MRVSAVTVHDGVTSVGHHRVHAVRNRTVGVPVKRHAVVPRGRLHGHVRVVHVWLVVRHHGVHHSRHVRRGVCRHRMRVRVLMHMHVCVHVGVCLRVHVGSPGVR